MKCSRLRTAAALLLLSPLVQAEGAPDPLFGNDPHAKAVLDCHADYARRYARRLSSTIVATPTEVAIAASAHCAGTIDRFNRATLAAAKGSDDPAVFLNPLKHHAEQVEKMRTYSFAYAIDAYLKNTAAFLD